MSKKIFLKKTYAEAVKGDEKSDIEEGVPGESVIKPQLTGFPYHKLSPAKTSQPCQNGGKLKLQRRKRVPREIVRKVKPVVWTISSDSDTSSTPKKRGKKISAVVSPYKGANNSPATSPLPALSPIKKGEEEAQENDFVTSPIVISDKSEDEKNSNVPSPVRRQLFKRKYIRSDSSDSLPDIDSVDYIPEKLSKCHDEFVEYYENNPLLPIYKSLNNGITTKEAVEILLKKLRPNQLTRTIPIDINRNAVFVYSINSIGHWKNALCDGMGCWIQNGKTTNQVRVGNGGILVTSIANQHENSEKLRVIRRKYTNKSYPKLHRNVIQLQDSDSDSILGQMLVQYYFDGKEVSVTVAAHGNSNETSTSKYRRTFESTKSRIKELCSFNKPKDVFHTLIEDEGGLNEIKCGSQIPRDRQQIRNFNRKSPPTPDPVIECLDLAKRQEKTDGRFLREVRASPEFTMFMSTDRQLTEIEKFCTNKANLSVLGIDTTFNIGEYYVSITTYRNLMLTNSFGVEPVMIGPMLLHQGKSFDSYFKLSSSLLQNSPNLKNLQVFGTDGDVNLSNAFEVCFPSSTHLLCDIHMVDNIERKLNKLNIRGNLSRQYIQDIFGRVHKDTKIKGLVDYSNETEMNRTLEQLKKEWISRHENGKDFLQYFLEHKLELIKNCMSAEVRSRCGLGFPPKPYTQNGNECINAVLKADIFSKNKEKEKKLDPYDFVKLAEKCVRRQEQEVKLALIGKGEYKLKAEYRHLLTDENAFWKKSAQQREALFKRFQNEPLKEEEEEERDNIPSWFSQSESTNCIPGLPSRISEDIIQEADKLITTKHSIVPLPGDTEGKTYLVANNEKSSEPFKLKFSPNSAAVSCEKRCSRWSAFQVCEHTIGLAQYLGVLKEYLTKSSKTRARKGVKCNLYQLASTDMPASRGRKANAATKKRKGKISKTSKDTLFYEESSETDIDKTIRITPCQPFHLTFLAGLIRVCYGCGKDFKQANRQPPHDLILKRFDHRIYTSPRTKQKRKSINLQNTYFHLNAECARKIHPEFEMRDVIIHDEIKCQLTLDHLKILTENGIYLGN